MRPLDRLAGRFRLDHFGLVAPIYDQVITQVNLQLLLELLELRPEHRLLDVGGGTGRVSSLLAPFVSQVVLTDISSRMLGQARAKGTLRPSAAHAERLPFPDGTFDRILMVDAFHHVCDQQQTVGELMRVLAPGGRLVVEEPNIDTWPVRLVALAEKLVLVRSHFVRPAVMQRMFEARGGLASVYLAAEDTANAWLLVQRPSTG